MFEAVGNRVLKDGRRVGKNCLAVLFLFAFSGSVWAQFSADTQARAGLYEAVAGNALDVLVHTDLSAPVDPALSIQTHEAFIEAAIAWSMPRRADAVTRYMEEARSGDHSSIGLSWLKLAEYHIQGGNERLANHYLTLAEDAQLNNYGQGLLGYLQSQRALMNDDVDAAIKAGRSMKGDASFQALVDLNIASAMVNSGEVREGLRHYLKVDDAPRSTVAVLPMEVIKDHSALFSGNAWLIEGKPEYGNSSLRRVRMNSIDANKALLGLGWTDISRQEDKRALAPWLHLTEQRSSDPAVQEAHLLAPFALTRLGYHGRAINIYEQGVSLFKLELQQMKSTQYAVRSSQWMGRLAKTLDGRVAEWPEQLRAVLGHSAAEAVFPALNEPRVASALEQYLQLRTMELRAGEWRSQGLKLPAGGLRLLKNGRDLQEGYAAIVNAAVSEHLKNERARLEGFLNHAQYSLAESYQRLGQQSGGAQ